MKARIVMIIMAVALVALPTMAQQQEWKSTSTMQGTGSVYAPQVTSVGAVGVASMGTTTESYSPAKAPGGPRRGNYNDLFDTGADTGQSKESPIGDALIPMMLMALAFCGVVYYRRKKALNS